MGAIQRLQAWYKNECNGEWEHTYGMEIGTLDNPGWIIKIDLCETSLENCPFEKRKYEKTEDDWYFANLRDGQFYAACGPENLEEVLNIFCDWAEKIDA